VKSHDGGERVQGVCLDGHPAPKGCVSLLFIDGGAS
jgi:hypothetical protein